MSFEKNERIPHYVPLHIKAGLKLRKILRQFQLRRATAKAVRGLGEQPTPDGPWDPPISAASREEDINKSAVSLDEDLMKSGVKETAAEIATLKETLTSDGLRFTNTAGGFISRMYWPDSEKNKLWENAWTYAHAEMKPGLKVLDVGGASTVFSFYLASKGCDVTVVDNDWNNCGTIFNSDYVSKKMQWRLKAVDHNITEGLPFKDETFDRVFCVCVLEHLPTSGRMRLMGEIARVLKSGGIAAFTVDYTNSFDSPLVDKGLRFGYLQKFRSEVLAPSGLTLMGNESLPDTKPDDDFLGAFFLRKIGPESEYPKPRQRS